MSLFEHLEELYSRKGYSVYSKHSSLLPARPEGWTGPLPDLVVNKNTERVAIFLESSSSLADHLTPSRWCQAIDNHAVLKLYVRDPDELNLLKTILRREGLLADVTLFERRGRRHRHRSGGHGHRKWIRIAIVLVLISVCCLAILWVASNLYDYQGNHYQPRDQERGTGSDEPSP